MLKYILDKKLVGQIIAGHFLMGGFAATVSQVHAADGGDISLHSLVAKEDIEDVRLLLGKPVAKAEPPIPRAEALRVEPAARKEDSAATGSPIHATADLSGSVELLTEAIRSGNSALTQAIFESMIPEALIRVLHEKDPITGQTILEKIWGSIENCAYDLRVRYRVNREALFEKISLESLEFAGLSVARRFETERLALGPIREGDIDALTEMFAGRDTLSMSVHMPLFFGRDQVVNHLKNMSQSMLYGNCLYLAIALSGVDRLIGITGVTFKGGFDVIESHSSWHKDYRRQGYITEAAKCVMDYLFKSFGVKRREAHCLSENVASQGLMEKCGFEFERDGSVTREGGESEPIKFYFLLRDKYLKDSAGGA
jgi:ribosomal-protein-alanine N-acetyltransferase